jgi:hypothetical protein
MMSIFGDQLKMLKAFFSPKYLFLSIRKDLKRLLKIPSDVRNLESHLLNKAMIMVQDISFSYVHLLASTIYTQNNPTFLGIQWVWKKDIICTDPCANNITPM